MDINARNLKGQTALDVSEQIQSPRHDEALTSGIRRLLVTTNRDETHQSGPQEWVSRKRDAIMVVAVLIATMAFQAALNPAGGVWQDDLFVDSQGKPVHNPHRAGEAVMAYTDRKAYKYYTRANTFALVSSLSTILLLISGLPLRRTLFMWILMVIVWFTVTPIAIAYGIAVVLVTPKKERDSASRVMEISISVWCGVMGILLVGNTARLLYKWLKHRGTNNFLRRPSAMSRNTLAEVNHDENNGGNEIP